MNSDMQRILDKATELLDMMTAVRNKWDAQGRAGDVRKLIEAETTIRAALNGAANPSVPPDSSPLHIGTFTVNEEQSTDKPDAPKRGKK